VYLLELVYDSLEGLRVSASDLRQGLAIKIDAGSLELWDQGRVGQSVVTSSSIDAGNPKGTEVTLTITSVSV
jgi:hypothetical protein